MPRDGSNVYHRPPGIDAITNTTISSSSYNLNVQDVESDLNLPRPIVAGGTGANNAAQAMQNLGGELAGQVVTNYDAGTFQAGSFYSASNATNPPVASHAFNGICYVTDTNNMTIEARDATTGYKYFRQKTAGTWGSWVADPNKTTSDAAYVLKAGDTMTGNLTVAAANAAVNVTPSSGSAALSLSKKTATDFNVINGTVAGTERWQVIPGDNTAESGSNAGSNFQIVRFNDSGGYMDTPLIIDRASGGINTSTQFNCGGAVYAQGGVVAGNSGSGMTYYFGPPANNHYMSFDGTNVSFTAGGFYTNGLLSVSGVINCGSSIGASGQVSCNNVLTSGVNVQGGSYQQASIYYFGTDNAYYWNDERGNARIACNQNVFSYGYLIAGSYIQSNTGRFIALRPNTNPGFACYETQWGCAGMWAGAGAGGVSFGSMDAAGNGSAQWALARSDYFLINPGTAYKPGGGSWAASSDARIKNILGDYTNGLDAILALHPVRYTYKGNDTRQEPLGEPILSPPSEGLPQSDTTIERKDPTVPYHNSGHYQPAVSGQEFIGLIAQEAEVPMPEIVTMSEGYIDGEKVADMRQLDQTPLVFALINAVKTLTARIEALEAR